MLDLVTRLILNNDNFDNNLKKSEQQIKKFDGGIASLGKSAAKFAGSIGIAVGGMEMFTTAMNSNGRAQAAWTDAVNTAKLAVDNFFTSLMSGDWSVWENGIDNALTKMNRYSTALRGFRLNPEIEDLGMSLDEQRLDALENIINDEKRSKKEREDAWKDYQNLSNNMEHRLTFNDSDRLYKNIESMLVGKGVKDRWGAVTGNYRYPDPERMIELIRDFIPVNAWDGTILTVYQDLLDELQSAKNDLKIATNNTQYGGINNQFGISSQIGSNKDAIDSANERIRKAKESLDDFKKSVSVGVDLKDLDFMLDVKNKFNEEEIGTLMDALSKYVDINSRRIQTKNQRLGLQELFDANGNLKPKTESTKPSKPSPSYSYPNDLIAVKLTIPETTLGELESKKAYIIKQMNTANQEDYVKLKVKLDETEADISRFKRGGINSPLSENPLNIDIESGGKGYESTAIQSNYDYADGLNAIASSLQTVSALTNEGASAWLTYAANCLSSTGTMLMAIHEVVLAKTAEGVASAGAEAAKTPIVGWLMVGAGIAAAIAAFASVPKFASGGIVGGNNTFGDFNIARVNSGEMILNNTQQRNLFSLLNTGSINGGANEVKFTIEGRQLVGVLSNYNNKLRKTL